jgi:tRNA (guanine6-N2)-methyltransferase
VFLLMGEVAEVPRDRSALGLLRGLTFDLDAASALARRYDPIDTRKFTVVASALGKRNYGRYEMESALGSALSRGRWSFEDSRLGHADSERLSVRLHIDAGAFVALRIFQHPLHRRAYRTDTSIAALRPTVAAGLCLLANPRHGERLHDPFCGVGTIPIEAALGGSGVSASGTDIDPEQIESARQNAERAGCALELRTADVGSLPFDSSSVHAVVTNPPWDQKVELAGEARDEHWLAEVSRVLVADGRLVLLVADPAGIEAAASKLGWALRVRFQLSLFGSHPTVLGFTRSGSSDGSWPGPTLPPAP